MATTVDYILKVQTGKAQKGLDDTAKAAAGAQKSLLAAAGSMASVVTAAGVLATGMIAVAGALIDAAKAAVQFGQESADLINDINDLSNRSAIAADTIKGLQFALQASGQDASQATSILSKFPAVLSMAEEESSRTAQAFKKLGVEIKNADGSLRPANDVFLETLTRLQAIDDQTTRAKMAFDVFGRSASQLLQALGQSQGLAQFVAFTEKFGVRTGPKASDAAADFQVVMAGLDTVAKGLKSTFIETFGPAITQMLIKFGAQLAFIQSIIISLSDTISLVFTAALNTMSMIFEGLLSIFPKVARALIGMIPIFGNLSLTLFDLAKPIAHLTGMDKKFAGFFNAVSGAINKAQKDAKEFENQLQGLIGGGFTPFQVTGGGGGGGGGGAVSAAAPDFTNFVNGIDELINQLDSISIDLEDLDSSLKDLPALMEKTFKIAVAGSITNAILSGVSGPAGFLSELGSALSGVTMGLSEVITGAITGIARLGEKSPKEIQQDFNNFVKAFENGLKMLPRVLIQVLPRFVVALIRGIGETLLKLPFIIADAFGEAFKRLWENIKEFFRDIFTREGRQERRQQRRERRRTFFENLGESSQFYLSGGIMSAQSGARFTRGKRGLAMLHEGETVLPASGRAGQAEQRMMNQAGGGGGINIVINSAVVENRAIDELVRKLETRFGQFGVGKSSLFGR